MIWYINPSVKKKITSWGSPFQPLNHARVTFDIRFAEPIGLGLLCRYLSSSPNPWFGSIPETLKISETEIIYLFMNYKGLGNEFEFGNEAI